MMMSLLARIVLDNIAPFMVYYLKRKVHNMKDSIGSVSKRNMTIFYVIVIVLTVGMLVILAKSFFDSFFDNTLPDDLIEISCCFESYELDSHTRSSSYDLFLNSSDYELPFRLQFFDGYKNQISPKELCTGKVYSIRVRTIGSCYEIYTFSDSQGNLLMTKDEAYSNSQKTAGIVLAIMFLAILVFWVFCLIGIHRPTFLGGRMSKIAFGKRYPK